MNAFLQLGQGRPARRAHCAWPWLRAGGRLLVAARGLCRARRRSSSTRAVRRPRRRSGPASAAASRSARRRQTPRSAVRRPPTARATSAAGPRATRSRHCRDRCHRPRRAPPARASLEPGQLLHDEVAPRGRDLEHVDGRGGTPGAAPKPGHAVRSRKVTSTIHVTAQFGVLPATPTGAPQLKPHAEDVSGHGARRSRCPTRATRSSCSSGVVQAHRQGRRVQAHRRGDPARQRHLSAKRHQCQAIELKPAGPRTGIRRTERPERDLRTGARQHHPEQRAPRPRHGLTRAAGAAKGAATARRRRRTSPARTPRAHRATEARLGSRPEPPSK